MQLKGWAVGVATRPDLTLHNFAATLRLCSDLLHLSRPRHPKSHFPVGNVQLSDHLHSPNLYNGSRTIHIINMKIFRPAQPGRVDSEDPDQGPRW